MNDIKIVIVEDEQPAARSLERKLEKLGYRVLAKLDSVEQAISYFELHPVVDLIFLDIQLSDGLSFEIFEKVELKSAIIFTTAYDEYALRAFKLNSIDYLLKPLDIKELEIAITKFKDNRTAFYGFDQQLNLFKEFLSGNARENRVAFKERFSVKIGAHIKIVTLDQIVCFFSENKTTYIKTEQNRDYPLDMSMDEVEKLVDPTVFYRINRKFFICIHAIKDIYSYSNSRLKINMRTFEHEDLIVSREKVNDFKKWIQ